MNLEWFQVEKCLVFHRYSRLFLAEKKAALTVDVVIQKVGDSCKTTLSQGEWPPLLELPVLVGRDICSITHGCLQDAQVPPRWVCYFLCPSGLEPETVKVDINIRASQMNMNITIWVWVKRLTILDSMVNDSLVGKIWRVLSKWISW